MNNFIAIIITGCNLVGFCISALRHQVFVPLLFAVSTALSYRLLSMSVRAGIKLFQPQIVDGRVSAVMLLLLAALLAQPARADGPSTNQLVLTWDVLPDYGTNDTFYVYSSTNVAQPMSQWPAVTNVTFKQFMVATNVAIPPATDVKRFYTFVSSNFTGRSDFAEPDSCRRLPSGSGLRIGGR